MRMEGRVVTFGEVMLRLSSPGHELLLQTPRLDTYVAGAEANVAAALARLGHPASLVTVLPDNPLGDAALADLRSHGINCEDVRRATGRMGLYFLSAGTGVRSTEATYDRAGSTFALSAPDSWDWMALLHGAARLHLTGITPALGEGPAAAALAAAEAAHALGVPLSFDGNYRARLWNARGSDPAPILRTLIGHADVLFGDHRDIALALGQTFDGDREAQRTAAIRAAFETFPALQLIASTAREMHTADTHSLSARIDTRGGRVTLGPVRLDGIVGRVGAGDAFAAGVLHGLMRGDTDHGAATGLRLAALKHSIPGDVSLFSVRDVDQSAGISDIRR